MPVPHPTAVIGQQLANGRPSPPPWRERQHRPRRAGGHHQPVRGLLVVLSGAARGAHAVASSVRHARA